jgi:hypothetical protein
MGNARGSERKNARAEAGADAGTKTSGLKSRVRSAILSIIAVVKSLLTPWESAKGLFNPKKTDGVLSDALADADLRLAINTLILSGLITFFMSLVNIIESVYVENAYSATIQDTTGVVLPIVGLAMKTPLILMSIINLPVSIITSLVLGYCAFRILRMLGGKATFAQHLYIYSVVTLATAFGTGLFIFFSLPIINILVAILLIFINFYLAVIVSGRAYSIAHRIGPVPGFATALVIAVLNVVITFYLPYAIGGVLSLPPQSQDFIFQGA